MLIEDMIILAELPMLLRVWDISPRIAQGYLRAALLLKGLLERRLPAPALFPRGHLAIDQLPQITATPTEVFLRHGDLLDFANSTLLGINC